MDLQWSKLKIEIFVFFGKWGAGMYSSSNRDFVRTSVMDFYEMFKQSAAGEGDLSAFNFNDTLEEGDRVCPLDDFELELKIRNEAMKSTCASVQVSTLRRALRIVRIVVDKIVEFNYVMFQIGICFFRLLVVGASREDPQQVTAEMQFYFERLVQMFVDALKVYPLPSKAPSAPFCIHPIDFYWRTGDSQHPVPDHL